MAPLSLSKNPRVDKGPQSLMALFGFGDMRGKSVKALAQQGFPCIRCWPRHRCKHRMKKLKKVAFSHFFDTMSTLKIQSAVFFMHLDELDYGHLGSVATTGTHLEDAGVAAVASLVLGGDLVE